MFCYQKNFSNPTLPVDEAQFWALVRAKQWNENIDKSRQSGCALLAPGTHFTLARFRFVKGCLEDKGWQLALQ